MGEVVDIALYASKWIGQGKKFGEVSRDWSFDL